MRRPLPWRNATARSGGTSCCWTFVPLTPKVPGNGYGFRGWWMVVGGGGWVGLGLDVGVGVCVG